MWNKRERGGFAVGTNDQHSCVCVGKERLFLTSSWLPPTDAADLHAQPRAAEEYAQCFHCFLITWWPILLLSHHFQCAQSLSLLWRFAKIPISVVFTGPNADRRRTKVAIDIESVARIFRPPAVTFWGRITGAQPTYPTIGSSAGSAERLPGNPSRTQVRATIAGIVVSAWIVPAAQPASFSSFQQSIPTPTPFTSIFIQWRINISEQCYWSALSDGERKMSSHLSSICIDLRSRKYVLLFLPRARA